ncbi:MAG TPA: NAD(P)/FAD-dependent oxidoreductase [Spirochaetia bacterium]|jgi:2-polyprenyl-6-methoxyphenol hydroxylase-like FAD-dependent oxidoreductase|nr:NAD(P)/FAD-dependent oxidoreductase [Spirochaetia bacterium]
MTDVVIVGAGPVGLLLAALLGRQGRSVLVLDKKPSRAPGSNAIGITPPSLDLLEKLGVAQALTLWGAPIRHVTVHGPQQKVLGTVDFQGLPLPHDFILSVPQTVTEQLLDQHLLEYPTVKVEFGWEFQSLDQDVGAVTAFFQDAHGNPRFERSAFVVGCDGVRSRVREAIDLTHRPKRFDSTFLMGDYADDTGWGPEAHLFFTPRGAVESFPLGQGKRRWIVQTPQYLDTPGTFLEDEVEARTGLKVPAETCTWKSPFGIHRWVSPHYAYGRVYLAGDSAHQMSPIGGQGMNTGFADAEFLASLLGARFDNPKSDSETWNRLYSQVRHRAGRVAAGRAELSMAIGTVRGPGSALRNGFLGLTLRLFPGFFPRHYGMLTIPGRNLAEAKRLHPRPLSALKEIS